jgi:AcrR family transcriptional regulator
LTLAAIAEKLGVRTPSLYNHIDGLQGLKREMAVYAVRELTAKITQAAIGKSGDDAIVSILLAYREFAQERPGLYESAIRTNDSDDTELQAATLDLVSVMIKVLAPYNLTEDNAIHAIRTLRSIAHGFISLEATGLFKGRLRARPLDPAESYRIMIEVFLIGFHGKRNAVNRNTD